MPRKRSEVPPALRIRENQRRSRVRKKELIEDLQSRLRSCEKEQVQATVLVQHAARKVVWENAQLRHLLARSGVDGQRIDEFLRSQAQVEPQRHSSTIQTGQPVFLSPISVNTDSTHKTPTHSQAMSPIRSPIPSSLSHLEAAVIMPDSSSLQPNHHPAIITELLPSSVSDNISEKSDCGTADLSLNPVGLDQNLLPYISDCYCPELAQDSSIQGEAGSMSCEAAASIIAGMRGHNNEALALRELGCEQDIHCQIKNIQVLQVMVNE